VRDTWAASFADARLPAAVDADDAAMVRINLRLPSAVKGRIEDAAAGTGLSVNAWIVRATATALELGADDRGRSRNLVREIRSPGAIGQHYSGWAR